MDKLDFIKRLFDIWVKLPGVARGFSMLCLMGAFIAGYAYWYDNYRQKSTIEEKIDSFKEQNDDNWKRQFRHNNKIDSEIDSLKSAQNATNIEIAGFKKDMSNISIILAANSNDELLNRIVPLLKESGHDAKEAKDNSHNAYKLILEMNRRMVLDREYKAGVRKVEKQ